MEFETRLDEASGHAGLQPDEVSKFFLFFKHIGLSAKTVDDIKLQGGDHYKTGSQKPVHWHFGSVPTTPTTPR